MAGRGDAARGGSAGVEQDRRVAQAREAIARALAIDPGHALSVARLAMIERRTAGMEAYAAGIQRAVALSGTDPEVLLHAGEALALLGRTAQALPIDFWVAARGANRCADTWRSSCCARAVWTNPWPR